MLSLLLIWVINIWLLWCIGLHFVTGYYKKGNIIMKRGLVVRHYLRTWFIFDLLATFPFNWAINEKKIDYWPEYHESDEDDDFSNIFIKAANLPPTFSPTSETDFGLPALLRLLKLIRIARLIKFFQLFKLRKLVYRVSLSLLIQFCSMNGFSSMIQ